MKEMIAKIVSALFGFPIIVFLIVYGVFMSGMSQTQAVTVLSLLIILQIIIPFGIFAILYKKGIIHDIDVVDRKERILPFAVTTICFVVALYLCKQFGNEFVFNYQLILLTSVLVSFAITLFWKISLHTGIFTVAFIFLYVFSGAKYVFFLALLPIVYWARLYLKRHTHAQLIAGIVVNALVTLSLISYFKMF